MAAEGLGWPCGRTRLWSRVVGMGFVSPLPKVSRGFARVCGPALTQGSGNFQCIHTVLGHGCSGRQVLGDKQVSCEPVSSPPALRTGK